MIFNEILDNFKEYSALIPFISFFVGIVLSVFGYRFRDKLAAKVNEIEKTKLLLDATRVDLEVHSSTLKDDVFFNRLCLVRSFEEVYGVKISYDGLQSIIKCKNSSNAIEEYIEFGHLLVFDTKNNVFVKKNPIHTRQYLYILGFWMFRLSAKVQLILCTALGVLFTFGLIAPFVSVLEKTQEFPTSIGVFFSILFGLGIVFAFRFLLESLRIFLDYERFDNVTKYLKFENRFEKI